MDHTEQRNERMGRFFQGSQDRTSVESRVRPPLLQIVDERRRSQIAFALRGSDRRGGEGDTAEPTARRSLVRQYRIRGRQTEHFRSRGVLGTSRGRVGREFFFSDPEFHLPLFGSDAFDFSLRF